MNSVFLAPESFSVRFTVCPNGVDPHSLEFLLHAAEERNGKGYGFYSDALWDQMKAALKCARKDRPQWAEVTDKQSYGAEQFVLEVENKNDMESALSICTVAANVWATKYRVQKMKVGKL